MDATKKPLLIPPEFSNYAEKHGIFQIYEVRYKGFLTDVPKTEDPVSSPWKIKS